MTRASIFVAALSGSVVALALVAQATDFGESFIAFALVLLPVVFFLGVVTVARLGQVNYEDAVFVQGMNRLRHAYLELAPELEPYFVTSRYDDDTGILLSTLGRTHVPPTQAFVAIPGVVALLDSVVAAIAGVGALGLGVGTGWSIVVGVPVFLATVGCFALWAERAIRGYRSEIVVRFPTPATDEHVETVPT